MKKIFFISLVSFIASTRLIAQVRPDINAAKEKKDLVSQIQNLAATSAPGTYLLSTYTLGDKLNLVLTKNKPIAYTVTNALGKAIPLTSIQIRQTDCWSYWKDSNGDMNWFKKPCLNPKVRWAPAS